MGGWGGRRKEGWLALSNFDSFIYKILYIEKYFQLRDTVSSYLPQFLSLLLQVVTQQHEQWFDFFGPQKYFNYTSRSISWKPPGSLSCSVYIVPKDVIGFSLLKGYSKMKEGAGTPLKFQHLGGRRIISKSFPPQGVNSYTIQRFLASASLRIHSESCTGGICFVFTLIYSVSPHN